MCAQCAVAFVSAMLPPSNELVCTVKLGMLQLVAFHVLCAIVVLQYLTKVS